MRQVSRSWRTGDTIDVDFPFRLRTEGFRDNPNRLAFLHGPSSCAPRSIRTKPIPAIVTEPGRLLASLRPVARRASTFAGSPQAFRVPGESAGAGVVLEPFTRCTASGITWSTGTSSRPSNGGSGRRSTPPSWPARKELDSRTVDRVIPGEEQNERDHKLEGEKTGAGGFGDRKWRHAEDGGFFRYVLKVCPHQPQAVERDLLGQRSGSRVFDILVDGKKLATETLRNNRPEQFYDQLYPLPEDLTKGKSQVTVTFQAHPDNTPAESSACGC